MVYSQQLPRTICTKLILSNGKTWHHAQHESILNFRKMSACKLVPKRSYFQRLTSSEIATEDGSAEKNVKVLNEVVQPHCLL